jgi:hypothetical protein
MCTHTHKHTHTHTHTHHNTTHTKAGTHRQKKPNTPQAHVRAARLPGVDPVWREGVHTSTQTHTPTQHAKHTAAARLPGVDPVRREGVHDVAARRRQGGVQPWREAWRDERRAARHNTCGEGCKLAGQWLLPYVQAQNRAPQALNPRSHPQAHIVGIDTNSVPRASSMRAQSSITMWCTSVPAGSADASTPMCSVKKLGLFLYRFLEVGVRRSGFGGLGAVGGGWVRLGAVGGGRGSAVWGGRSCTALLRVRRSTPPALLRRPPRRAAPARPQGPKPGPSNPVTSLGPGPWDPQT